MTTGKVFKRASSFQKAKTRDQFKSPRVQFDLPQFSPSDDKEEELEPLKKDKTRLCASERMDPEERSTENIIFMITYRFVCHWLFQFIIFLLIIGNTLSLASFSYPMSQHKEDVLYKLNVFFTWTFTFEMIVKLIGFGPNNYRKDYFNLFDALLVILSLIDWGLTLPSHLNNEISSSDGGLLKVFRALRLLRIIKLARRWTGLQKIIKKTAESALDILTFAVLLLLFVFIFALLGMEFFAFRVRIDVNTDQIIPYSELQERFDQDPTSLVPIRENFDSIGRAMTTVFSIITLEDWQWRLFNHIQPFPRKYSTPITLGFIFCICIGSFTLLSLFTAILLQNFEALEEEEEEDEDIYGSLSSFQSPTKVYEKKRSAIIKKKTMKQQSSKFFSIATWNKFKFEFIKIFDLRQQHITFNQVAAKNASPVSGVGSPGSISEFDIQEGSKPNQEEQNIEIKDQEHDQIQCQSNEIKLIQKSHSEERVQSRNLNRTYSNGSSKTPLRKQSSNLNMGMNVLEMTTVVLPHLKYHSALTNKLSAVDLALFQSQAEFTDIYGTSLFLFTRTNKFRLLVAKLVKKKAFDYFILALIAISTINLAFDTPLRDPVSKLNIVLTKIDYFMTAVFTTEAILKIIAYGFTTPKHGYLRNPWNLLDGTVVFFSLLAIALEKVPLLQVIKIVRVVRVLRPLRVVSKHKGLQIAITSLINSMPGIMNLQLVVFFVITMLSILHTFIFYGRMGSCQTDKLSFHPTHLTMLIKNKQDCINYGGEWQINDFNFNNFGRSFLTLFTIQTQENWIETMWLEVDGTGPDQAPITDNNNGIVFLCIGTNMILSLLFLNLFVGVVVETYNLEKEKQSKNLYLQESQRQWIDVQLMAYSAKPEAELTETNFKLRRLLRQLIKLPAFEYFIMACIFGNTIVLCISWYGIGKETIKITDYFNYTFMGIFAMEAIFKIIALDKHYFHEKWNIFDFVVVVTTAFVVILESLNIGSIGKQASILRSLRILRVLRIFKKFKRLQIIFRTLTDAAPSMGSLGLLLLLLIFIYAILGMQLFGYTSIKNQTVMDQHVNFQTFISSVLLLLRCTTGESWNQIMFDCARQRSLLFQCNDHFDYNDYVKSKHTNKCGSPTAAYIYFITFVLIVTQIFLNIFIAIAVDSFLVQVERAQLLVSENDIEQFTIHWKAFDPSGSGFIPSSKLELFILELCKDNDCDLIYLKDPMIKRPKVRSIMISKMSIPTYDIFQHVYFYDVLLCLCKEKLENEYDRDKGLLHKEKIKFLIEMEKTLVRENKNDIASKNMLAKTRNLIKEELKRNQISENQLQSTHVTSEYTKMLQGLKDINPNVERVQKLQKEAKSKHKKCVVREVDLFENKDKKVFYYTTAHFIYGNILKNGLRLFINRKNENKQKSLAQIIRANKMLQNDSGSQKSVSDQSTIKADALMIIRQPEGLSTRLTANPEKQINDSQVKCSSPRRKEDQIDTLEADNTNYEALKLVRDYKTIQIMNELSP